MKSASFLMYHSFYEPVKDLSFEDKGKLFDAIFNYQIYDIVGDLPQHLNIAFSFMKYQFDMNSQKYEAICERNRKNGSKGGRKAAIPVKPKKPSGLFGNPKNPDGADNDNDNDNDLKEESIKKKTNRFSPPTLDQVKEYFIQNGYSENLAEKAFDYYSSGSWKDSQGKPVKNWKQKMIAVWFRKKNLPKSNFPINGHEFEFDPAQKPI